MPTVRELPDAKEFSDRLNKVLRARGYGVRGSNKRLASEYGVKAPVVSEWRSGKYLPSHGKVKAMARAWRVPETWLYWGEGPEPDFLQHGVVPSASNTDAESSEEAIDVLRYAVSALFATTASVRPEAARRLAASIRAEKRPEFVHLVRHEFVQKLLEVLDKGVRKSKTHRGAL